LAERLQQPAFVVSLVAALATGTLAAVAAFVISLPDRSRWWLLLPAPALVVWVSTIGYGCFADWVSIGPDGLRLGETVRCFATLLLASVPLTLGMLVMLRYAALRPRRSTPGSSPSHRARGAATALPWSSRRPPIRPLRRQAGRSDRYIATPDGEPAAKGDRRAYVTWGAR
jgi:hypothetical protein